jgi:hypothetical protein
MYGVVVPLTGAITVTIVQIEIHVCINVSIYWQAVCHIVHLILQYDEMKTVQQQPV